MVGIAAWPVFTNEVLMKNWRFIASGVGLTVSAVYGVLVATTPSFSFVDRLCCSILLISFGYLFLGNKSPLEAGTEPPWWW
jgi:hypothetical protein